MSNERVEAWLRGLDFDPEPEPEWITSGRKPDFFARGASPLWVEVKTMDPDPMQDIMGAAWSDLKDRFAKSRRQLRGGAYVMVGHYDARIGKLAVALAEEAVGLLANGAIPIVMIPGDGVASSRARLEYRTAEGRVIQFGPMSTSGVYQHHPSLEPVNWSEPVDLHTSAGPVVSAPVYRHLSSRVPFALTLRVYADEDVLTIRSLGTGVALEVTTVARIRTLIADANSQLRNGYHYAQAPGLLVIHQDHLPGVDAHQVLAAVFGDVTVPIERDSIRAGPAFLGRNGAWRPNKNRKVGALRYVGRDGAAVTVVNPYATVPFPWQSITDQAWILEGEQVELRAA